MTRKTRWTYDEITSSQLNMFRIVALVPFKNKTLTYYRTKFIGFSILSSTILLNIMYTCYGIRMLIRKQIEVDYVGEHLTISSGTVCYILFYCRREKILKVLETCKNLWKLITPDEFIYVRSYERKVYYCQNLILFSVAACSLTFGIPCHFTKLSSDFTNNTELIQFSLKIYYEIKSPLQYKLTLAFQDIVLFCGSLMLTGTQTISNFLVLMPCGYLKVLQERLLSVYNKDENETLNNEKLKNRNILTLDDIKINIYYHQRIMLLCKEVEGFLRSYYFMTVCATIFNMSILGLQMVESNTDLIKYGALFSLQLFLFFSCQWGSEFLLTESAAVGDAAYFASFNKVRNEKLVHTALCFMMLRAHKPIQMTAGGYIRLSRETFASMLKSAFSVFTILYNLK